jgi:hypothetical protein
MICFLSFGMAKDKRRPNSRQGVPSIRRSKVKEQRASTSWLAMPVH